MKRMALRASMLYIFILVFLSGAIYLAFTFSKNANKWAMSRMNTHLYKSGNLTVAGNITDRNGKMLASTVDEKRIYNDDKNIRTSTMHIVGDSQGYISTGVQNSYGNSLVGYNIIDGVYNLKKYGKGNDISLTIDSELNAAAYKALNGNHGTVGVMNYKTGELLCVVSAPSYDIANKPSQEINNDTTGKWNGVYINKLFTGVYVPGSTFKIITTVSALENIPDIESQKFKCKGYYEVDGGKIICAGTHGSTNLKNALNNSCNSAFGQIAIELGKDKLQNTANKFGINENLYVDGIRCKSGNFTFKDTDDNLALGWAGIGQHTTIVNPLRMLTVVCAVANGGSSPEPHIIQNISSPSGNKIYTLSQKNMKPYMSADIAKKTDELLRSDVLNNYGEHRFPNLKMAGKTGTAEVSSEKNGAAPHSWFVGYSQRDDLPLAIVVVCENAGSASKKAIPVSNDVMQAAIKYYKVK
ncbi:MAG: penicillin-binding transpeptidase domain-containing protein [Candidatus Fimenecus sp.]